MSQLSALLYEAVEKKLFRQLDIQFALIIAANEQPALQLAAACLSAETGLGNVCLPVSQLHQTSLFAGRDPELAERVWQSAGHPADWESLLRQSELVSDGSRATPMILDQHNLYLNRMWWAEGKVAAFLQDCSCPENFTPQEIQPILSSLFGDQPEDWQKTAAAVALTRRVSVISGGPGTGKTTTVARLLAALLKLSGSKLRIQLAAPTGKAAARLTESLGKALHRLELSPKQRQQFPTEAVTLHRLLGALSGGQRLQYHRKNPLHLDVLVVDEASMVDLPMMASLIDALPEQARVIFLGDRDQLASVEAGAVLGDICRWAEAGYSHQRAAELTLMTGNPLEGNDNQSAPAIRDSICLLRKSYRFDSQSGIGRLASAVNAGNVAQCEAVLAEGYRDIEYFTLNHAEEYQQLLTRCVAGYRPWLELIHQGAEPQQILTAFGHYQLLCVLREGPFGVSGLNARIETALSRQRLIRQGSADDSRWYEGRPVMITRNDHVLGLFNGDIGVALNNQQGKLKVFFQRPDGTVKAVQPSRLSACETAWVMTVHKSQGSEFRHTVLILPDHYLPIVTRELIYTAITRAQHKLTIYSGEGLLFKAVKLRTARHSGLAKRLMRS